MEIKTKYFDTVDISRKDVIYFKQGIFGFEESKEFVLLNFQENSDSLMCLQSLKEQELAFVLMNPFDLVQDYSPLLLDYDIENLEVNENTEGVLYYVVCVIKEKIEESTVNLKCPIVINPEKKIAKQIIMEKPEYEFRHTLGSLTTVRGE